MTEYKFIKRTRHTFMAGDILDEKYIIPSWSDRMVKIPDPDLGKAHPNYSSPEDMSADLVDKIEEIKGDLKDDGKLNHSNNDDKKSPGRPKKRNLFGRKR